MKKSLLLGAAMMMAGSAMAQLAPGEYYIRNVETGMFLNEGYSWGTHAVTKAYPCAFDLTYVKEEAGAWKVLGNEDNTTGFWSTWGDYVDITGNGTIHYEFYNYTAGNNNWDNWGLVITNGLKRGVEGYYEYLYLRADAYGWGGAYVKDSVEHDFDWETFRQEMDGALVNMDITREGTDVTIDAKVKAKDGTERFEKLTIHGVEAETIGTFLTCEGSHLVINPEVYGNPEPEEYYLLKSAYGYIFIDNGGEPYMDGAANPIYLEPADNAYNIKVGNVYLSAKADVTNYLNYDPLHVVDAVEAPNGNLSAWQILSHDEMIAALSTATPKNPVEASFFLNAGQIQVNASNNVSSWKYIKNGKDAEIVIALPGWYDRKDWDNQSIYAWCINEAGENKDHESPVAGTDVVSQEVQGMPAGIYKAEYRVVNQNNTPLVVKFNDTESKPYEYAESDLWYASAWDALAGHVETVEFEVGEDGKLAIRMEKTIDPEGQNRFAFKSFALSYLGPKDLSGVEGVEVDENAPVEYFNMQGLRVADPSNGIYIKRQGKKVSKVLVK